MHDAHTGPTPTRGPIEVQCDNRTAPVVARAVLARQLRGWTGVVAVGTSGALGAIVALGEGSRVVGLCYGLATLVLQVGWLWWSARRAIRRAMAPGQVLVSRYEPHGFLSLSTGLGSNTFAPGSVESFVRSSGLVRLRLLPSRHWAVLPGALFTDDDLAFLLGQIRTSGRPSTAARGLPLVHVVTPESQRGVQITMTGMLWRSADGVMSTIGVAIFLAWAVLAAGAVSLTCAAGMALAFVAFLAGPARRVQRTLPVGELVMADVTQKGLVLDQDRERLFLPWTSLTSVRVTRHTVVLTDGAGRGVAVPRPLFPSGDLERLRTAVRDAQLQRG